MKSPGAKYRIDIPEGWSPTRPICATCDGTGKIEVRFPDLSWRKIACNGGCKGEGWIDHA